LVRRFHDHERLPTEAWTDRALEALLRTDDRGFVLVAEHGGLVGYVVVGFGFSLEFAGQDAFVDELYVEPDERGVGAGTALLAEAERQCLAAGVHALHLEVDHANADARRLYERTGYQAHPRHLMTKWLRAPG